VPRYAQPALFVAGLAAVEALRKDSAATVDGCSVTAGLSLGEYTALVFAGALSFEDGLKVGQRCDEISEKHLLLRLQFVSCHSTYLRDPTDAPLATLPDTPAACVPQVVKARGECMAAAAKQGQPHGMLSVIGLSDADLESVWPLVLTTLHARLLVSA
jgi:[acyl-carrier-protein] S-malonyltransferase